MPLYFRNGANETVEFTTNGRYRLLDVSGLGGLEFEKRSIRSPFQDGETYIESVAKTREIELLIGIYGNDMQEVHQYFSELSSLFSAKLGEGVLEFDYAGKVRALNVSVDQAPVYMTGDDNRTKGFLRSTITLTANNPYWQDTETSFEELQTWKDTFALPLTLPFKVGERGESGLVTNGGDVDSPLQILIEGGFTPPLNIENVTTGETITITKLFDPEARLFIDTTPSKQQVAFISTGGVQTNGFHYLDPSSRLFQLARGANEIRVSALDSTKVYIMFKRQYISF